MDTGGHVQWHRAGHDEWTGIARGPQRMHDGTHQPKDTAGALEALQRGPVLVEPVKQLRVNRVRRPDPTLIRRLAALARELTTVFGVELHESPSHGGDVPLGIRPRLDEQPPPHDLERLVRCRWPPLVRHPANDVLQPRQRLPTVQATDLEVAADNLAGVARLTRRGNRDDEQRARTDLTASVSVCAKVNWVSNV